MARVNDPDLPDTIDDESAVGSKQKKQTDLLTDLGLAVATKRDEAVSARKVSGIEDVWQRCEESYLGIDDANRAQFASMKWAKPTTMQGPVTVSAKSNNEDEVHSTAFVRLTSRYVDAAAAKLSEILLPVDDKAFSIKPMPAPELTDLQNDGRPILNPATGQVLMRMPEDGEVIAPSPAAAPVGTPGATSTPQPGAAAPAAPGSPQNPPTQIAVTVSDMVNKLLDDAADSAEKAETRIYNWLVKSRYSKEARKIIFDAARIGVGVLKGPIPKMEKRKVLKKPDENAAQGSVTLALEIKEAIVPATKWIDPWNFFPDAACGEDVHSGGWCHERDYLTIRQLLALKELPGYMPEQIDKVIQEGPGKIYSDGASRNPSEVVNKDRFETWYSYGAISREELQATKAVNADKVPAEKKYVFVILTMVNDTVIKADLNPLESGAFPYQVFPWSRRAGCWAGVGVGEQIDMPQRMCNAGTRTLMDNAGIAAGVQIIINEGAVTPQDGKYVIARNKIWLLNSEEGVDDTSKAMSVFEIPDLRESLMAIIEYAFKLAEEACNIPLVTQGINDQNTPDTFGATNIQNENANTLLRSIGEMYDDCVTSPLINAYYEWLLLDPEVPDDEKAEFEIHAHGSSSLVERAIQVQTIQQVGAMVENPAFGADPRKWFAEFLRARRIDPRKIQMTPEEQAANMGKTPPPVPVQVAQVKAQADQAVTTAKIQGELQQSAAEMAHEQNMLAQGGATPHAAAAMARVESEKIRAQSEMDIESSRANAEFRYAQTERQIALDNAAAEIQKMRDQRDLLILEYSLKNNLTLQQVKAELAKTAMQEQTKRDLAAAEATLQQNQTHEDRAADVKSGLPTLSNPGAVANV